MSRAALIGTNIATALAVGVGTSLFWIAAYGNGAQKADVATESIWPGASAVAAAPKPSPVIAPSGLAVPVANVRPEALGDTFAQGRSGGSRVHDAIDIMAPQGTPVLAAAPGTIEKLFLSQGGGGITAYVRSNNKRWVYYYAHLQDYAPGLAEGQVLKRGDLIGRVGSTGNASPEGPHLHFAIHRVQPGDDWHEGTAINPYPLLAGNDAAR